MLHGSPWVYMYSHCHQMMGHPPFYFGRVGGGGGSHPKKLIGGGWQKALVVGSVSLSRCLLASHP